MDSAYFKTRYSRHPDRNRVWKAICEYLQPFIPPSGHVMDVGAGYCDFINQIQAGRKYAVDVNTHGVRCCGPGVQVLHATPIESMNVPAGSVDVVMASNLLEHLSPQQCSDL